VLGYPDPDAAPEVGALRAALEALLSGPGSLPVSEGWPELTPERIDRALRERLLADSEARLSVRTLMLGEASTQRVPLREGEVPILDSVEIVERPHFPHFGLELTVSGPRLPPADVLRARVRGLLSGPSGAPVAERWGEITRSLVQRTLARGVLSEPAQQLGVVALRIGERVVERIPLAPGSVPVLDDGSLVVTRGGVSS
jgi:hypothetical protein